MSEVITGAAEARRAVLATSTVVYRIQRVIDGMCPAEAGWRRTWCGAYVTWTRATLRGPQRVVLDRGHEIPGAWRVSTPAERSGWRVRPLGVIAGELRALVAVSPWT